MHTVPHPPGVRSGVPIPHLLLIVVVGIVPPKYLNKLL